MDNKTHMPKSKKAQQAEIKPLDEEIVDTETTEEEPESIDGIEVGDPMVLRPVELPLVVKPAKGKGWANEAQAEYAGYLNAYAYKNTKKWHKKKGVLLKRLVEIGKDAEKLTTYKGGFDGNISYTDKRLSQ